MASIIHHLAIGQLYYEKYLSNYSELEKNQFLLGVIAPDCGQQVGDETKRMEYHFIEHELLDDKFDLALDVPGVDKFIDKYKDKLNDPFVLGYLVHLITDKFWFEVVIPIFIRKSLNIIDSGAKTMSDLKHQSYVDWYYKTVYSDFDIHDIIIGAMVFGEKVEFPNFLEFDLSNLLIEEVNKECLRNFLEYHSKRLKFLININDEEAMEHFLNKKQEIKIADLSTISEFINKCIDYCFSLISTD